MKITIDTKEDSHEDIRKVIRLLSHMIGESSSVLSDNPSEPTPAATGAFSNLFSDDTPGPETEETSAPESQPEEEKQDDSPEVTPY